MNDWAFWPVFVATVLSVVGWSYFLWREHEGEPARDQTIVVLEVKDKVIKLAKS
jgi:hypothetical protein